jgi:hypothetical protein
MLHLVFESLIQGVIIAADALLSTRQLFGFELEGADPLRTIDRVAVDAGPAVASRDAGTVADIRMVAELALEPPRALVDLRRRLFGLDDHSRAVKVAMILLLVELNHLIFSFCDATVSFES